MPADFDVLRTPLRLGDLELPHLWHGGRVGHPETSGEPTVSSSAVPFERLTVFTESEAKAAIPTPRALEAAEIPGVIASFVDAARRALDAGFDGVEIHAANGYLLHQFLADGINRRDDEYGATPEGRARLTVELTRAVVAEIGASRVGIRLSPMTGAHETPESDGGAAYRVLARELAPLGLAYVHMIAQPEDPLTAELRAAFGAPLLLNTGFATHTERDEAIALVADGHADASVVGRAFIANPDLLERWATEADQNDPISHLFYAAGPEGYTDYPTLASV